MHMCVLECVCVCVLMPVTVSVCLCICIECVPAKGRTWKAFFRACPKTKLFAPLPRCCCCFFWGLHFACYPGEATAAIATAAAAGATRSLSAGALLCCGLSHILHADSWKPAMDSSVHRKGGGEEGHASRAKGGKRVQVTQIWLAARQSERGQGDGEARTSTILSLTIGQHRHTHTHKVGQFAFALALTDVGNAAKTGES